MFKKILAAVLTCAMAFTAVPSSAFALSARAEGAAAEESSETAYQADGYSVIVGNVRIQTLSGTLARVEVKGPKGFENRTTYHIASREFDFATPTVNVEDNNVIISTDKYNVIVPKNAESLDGIKITSSTGRTVWTYTSLPSASQYLPDPGDTPNAWAIADNPRIVPAEWGYSPMPEGTTENADINGWDDDNQAPDMYIFLPQKDYKTLLKDYITLTGSSEMIPLKAFGLWHSRYYDYKQQEALDLIDEYRENGYPLDNFVVDTNWRVGGSKGYDINTASWPNMEQFLSDAHDKNVTVTFNDHPEPQENQHALSQVDLNYRNFNFVNLLKIGLDAWWFDRNWECTIISPFSGINKESFGLYLYYDVTKTYYESIAPTSDTARRALIMGNVDGIDNGSFNRAPDMASHRYSIQWTGDIHGNTGLIQEIKNIVRSSVLTATPYMSSDISGHYDEVSDGLMQRWSQYAALSPIIRYHSNWGINHTPLAYGAEAQNTAKAYINMRYRLLPLYYSLSHENYETGLPMIRRLDINYPQYAEAQDDTEYTLGDNILVAPIWEEGTASRDIFIPDGRWIDVYTGKTYEGPQTVTLSYTNDISPIFVRSGSITPLAENVSYIGEKDWSNIALDVYPSTKLNGENTLYEDDQETVAYKTGAYRTTSLNTSYDSTTGETVVKIGAADGTYDGADSFTDRTWKLRVHMLSDWGDIQSATLDGENVLGSVKTISKDSNAVPFAIEGGAADGDIAELTFTKPLTEESEVRIKFASPVDEKLPVYNDVSVNADVTEKQVYKSVDLTETGTYDWVRTDAANGEVSSVSKADSANIIGNITADSQPESKDIGIDFSYSDGENGASDSSSTALSVSNGSIEFDTNVDTQDKQIGVYIAGEKAVGTLTISDGAKYSKTVTISSAAGKSVKAIYVTACAEQETTLHFKLTKTSGTGGIGLYAIAVSDPNLELNPVEYTATIDTAPESIDLSDENNIDWVHVGLNADKTAINRKSGTIQLLSDPEVTGDTAQVTDYSSAISFSDGSPTTSAKNSHNGIAVQGTVKISAPSTNTWRELKLYFGTWKDTNSVSVYDETGAEITNLKFTAGDTAETRCLTVRFRSDKDSTIYVEYGRESSYGVGNVSLAAYSLSEIGATSEQITAEMNEAPDSVDLSDGTYDWKHFGYTTASTVTRKSTVYKNVIGNAESIGDSLLRSNDFKTKFSWSDGTSKKTVSNTRSFAFSTNGEKIEFTVKRGEWDIDVYSSVWRAKGLFVVTDENGAMVDCFKLVGSDSASAYGKLTIHCVAEKPTTITVYVTSAFLDDGNSGNVSIAAAAMTQTKILSDYSALDEAVQSAHSIDTSAYTDASVSIFNSALTAAGETLADTALEQEDIDAALANLKSASDGLVKISTGDNNGGTTTIPSVTNGTQSVNGKTVLYQNGKAVTGTKVVTVSGKTYAVVGGYVKTGKTQVVKIGSKYYIVNASGVVQKGTKNKLIKVGTKSYVVNKNGVVQRKASGNKLVKVGTKSYIVNKLGVVQKGTKNKLVRIGKKAYVVNKKGVVQKNKKKIKVGKKTYKTNKKGVATLKN